LVERTLVVNLTLEAATVAVALVWAITLLAGGWRRHSEWHGFCATVLLAGGLVVLCSLCENLTLVPAHKRVWDVLQYAPGAYLPSAWLYFLAQYGSREPRLARRWVWTLLVGPPLLAVALAATNGAHRLLWDEGQVLVAYGPIGKSMGAGTVVMVAYAAACSSLGVYVLVRRSYWSQFTPRCHLVLLLVAPLLSAVGCVAARLPAVRSSHTPLGEYSINLGLWLVCWYLLSRERPAVLAAVSRELLLERLPDAVIVLDLRGHVVDANEAALQLVGRPRSATVTQSLVGVSPGLAEQLGSGAARGEPARTVVTLGGDSPRTYEVLAAALRAWDDAPVGSILVLRDLTEQRRAEEGLARERNMLRTLIENLPDRAWAKDRDSRFLFANRHTVKGLRCTSESEVLGKSDMDLLAPKAVAASFLAEERRIVETGEGYVGREQQTLGPDGRTEYYLNTKVPFYGPSGEVAGLVGITQSVTSIRRALEIARENEERYRRILETANEGIVSVDADWRITFANGRLLQLLGVTSAEAMGRPVTDIFYPEDLPDHEERVARRRLGRSERYERRLRRHDGSPCWCMVSATPLQDAEGRYAGSFAMLTDITERKAAEEQLRRAHDRLKATIEALPDILIETERDGTVIEIHTPSDERLPAPPSQLIGRTVRDLMPPDAADAIMAAVDRVAATGRPAPVTYVADVSLGSHWYEASLAPVGSTDSADFRIVAAVRDITERKRSEAALRLAEARLEALLQLSRMWGASEREITDYALEQGVRLTRSRIGYVAFLGDDETTLTMHSWSREAMAECAVRDVTFVYPVETTGLWGEAVRQRRPVITNDYAAPNPLKRGVPEGHVHVARHMNVPVFDGDHIVAVAGVGNKPEDYDESDVRELTLIAQGMWRLLHGKRAEAERRRLEGRVQQSQRIESLGILAGGIAHDFNNILAAIMGYAELSKLRAARGESLGANMDQILAASNRARGLVRQILTFTRQAPKETVSVHLGPIVAEALRFMRSTLPSTIEIEQRLDAGCGPVLADATQIHQVIVNLAANAGHAMRERGGVLTVALEPYFVTSAHPDPSAPAFAGEYVRLTVSDTGCGMAENVRERVFEPFFTTKEQGEGSGLGLAVSHGIVTSHGGTISVQSAPGEGSAFTILLPCTDEAPAPAAEGATPAPGRGERVLLVDDEGALALATERILSSLGYEVTTHTSSQSALGTFLSGPDSFDIVVSDQTMPGMTGLELAEQVRRVRPAMPFLLVTGFSHQIREGEAMRAAVDRILLKPYTLHQLAEAVREVLDAT
jgi:PAS domain S-box-containing protein